MAGYRPKSLEDINQSYDSEMSVTRAIKRETTRLSQNAPSVADVFSDNKTENEPEEVLSVAEEAKQIRDVSSDVEGFIKHISDQNKDNPAAKAAESKPAQEENGTIFLSKPVASKIENPFIPDPAQARTEDDFSSLMSDYVRVMNDLDDEPTEKKSFLSRKRNKKKKKEISETTEEFSEEIINEPYDDNETDSQENANDGDFDESLFAASLDELPEDDEPESNVEPEPVKEASENELTFDSLEDELENIIESVSQEEIPQENSEAEEEPEAAEEMPEKEKKKKGRKDKKRNKKAKASKEAEDETDTEETNVSEESTDSESKEDTLDFDLIDEIEDEEIKSNKKSGKPHNGARIFFRVILSIILVVSVVSTFAVGSLGVIFHVNEGVQAPRNIYLFTASRDFEETSVKAGDLVICNAKNFADDGQAVVYVDHENKTFAFGTKNGSTIGSDGEIYYIIGANTIIRQNVLGTVGQTIPSVGMAINLVYSYYIMILAVLLVVCIALFLIVTVGLRNRHKNEYAQIDNKAFETDSDLSKEIDDPAETEESPSEEESEIKEDDNIDLVSFSNL